VDRAHGEWNEYEYVRGRSSSAAEGVTGVRLVVAEPGPVLARLTVISAAPSAMSLVRTYTLGSGSDFLELSTSIDKAPVRSKEAVHIGFPFQVPGGQVRLDVPWAIVRPDSDQLPGADRNVFTVDRWADVSNDSIGVTWATLDASLIEVGGMWAEDWHHEDGTEGWLTHLPATQVLYSYVMNNYWHTNFKADQPGLVTFRYAIRPHGPWDPAAAERFGIERSQSLVPAVADTRRRVPPPALTSSDPAVIVTSLTPAGRNAIVVALFNPTDRPHTTILRAGGAAVRATLPPLGTRTLRVARGDARR
jgi:hypothetical protein